VYRGGSWINNPQHCRAAYRNNREPSNRNNNLGFRLARSSTPGRMAADEQVLALLSALLRQKWRFNPPDQSFS